MFVYTPYRDECREEKAKWSASRQLDDTIIRERVERYLKIQYAVADYSFWWGMVFVFKSDHLNNGITSVFERMK